MNEGKRFFDAATLTVWKTLEKLAELAAKLLAAIAKGLYFLADKTLDLIPEHRRGTVWSLLDKLLDLPAEIADSNLAEDARDAAESALRKFSDAMKRSFNLRLAVLATLAVALAFHFHPPSHWGPWKPYQTGMASYYSADFAGKKTSEGEIFNPNALTAAHKTLPLGFTVKVENPANGKVAYVKINDRGPYAHGRIIDLSRAAAKKLGILKQGVAKVKIYTR